MFTAIASAAVLSATTPVHSAEITHASNDYHASYQMESTVRFRQVEPRFASRAATPVCRWQAELAVNRAVTMQGRPVTAIAKPIYRFSSLSGTHASSCEAARSQVEVEIAQYKRARAAEAVGAAQQDRTVLTDELAGLRASAAKGE